MDEEELERYLNAIDALDPLLSSYGFDDQDIMTQIDILRDEDGLSVPGCYRTKPHVVEYL
jgi:hypothetical protein